MESFKDGQGLQSEALLGIANAIDKLSAAIDRQTAVEGEKLKVLEVTAEAQVIHAKAKLMLARCEILKLQKDFE